MSELFDRADALFVDDKMSQNWVSNKDFLLASIETAKTNIGVLVKMKNEIWDSSGVIDSKIAAEEARIERITSELKNLGVILESDDTNLDVNSVLDND